MKLNAIPTIEYATKEKDVDIITGLINTGFTIDLEDFRTYRSEKEREMPWEDFIEADPELNIIIEKLPYKLVVFSNWTVGKFIAILRRLETADNFEIVYSLVSLDRHLKPSRQAFEQLFQGIREDL